MLEAQTVLLFQLFCSSCLVTVINAKGRPPSDVTATTVAVKNMLVSKCYSYDVQIFAFPDTNTNDGLTSVTFENCDGNLPSESTVTNIPYGVMGRGKVLSMPANCNRKEGADNVRAGAFRVTAMVDDTSQEIIAIVNTDSELKPAGPPTYTINSDEDVDLEVDYPYSNEIVWAVDGLVTNKYRGQLKINVNQEGIYQAFSKRLGRDYSTITYRVIKRACPANMWGPPDCTGDCSSCSIGECDDRDGSCVCSPGVTGTNCDGIADDSSFSVSQTAGAELLCEKNGLANPGCKGILFCRRHPYGCSCMFNYGGIDCTKKCETNFYGFNCENEFN